MNKLIIFKEKHGDRYFLIQNNLDLEKAGRKIFSERETEMYYDYDDMDTVQQNFYHLAIKNRDSKSIWSFLKSRKNCEYEGFEEGGFEDLNY